MLTTEQVKALIKPFQPRDHEFLRGYAYITESAITERLESVDPAWTFEILRTDTRLPIRQGGNITVIVTARMTVGGSYRDGVGMQSIEYLRNKTDEKTGEVIEYKDHIEANEGEKSAATDALKRCARLFGIGRYLLDLPGNVKNMDSLTAHLKTMAVVPTLPPTPTPAQIAPQPPALPNDTQAPLKTPVIAENGSKTGIPEITQIDETDAWFAALEPTWNTIKSHLLKDVWAQFWLIVTAAKVYDNPKHMRNSVGKLQADGLIVPASHTLRQAIMVVVSHKSVKYGDNTTKLSTDDLKASAERALKEA